MLAARIFVHSSYSENATSNELPYIYRNPYQITPLVHKRMMMLMMMMIMFTDMFAYFLAVFHAHNAYINSQNSAANAMQYAIHVLFLHIRTYMCIKGTRITFILTITCCGVYFAIITYIHRQKPKTKRFMTSRRHNHSQFTHTHTLTHIMHRLKECPAKTTRNHRVHRHHRRRQRQPTSRRAWRLWIWL